MNAIQIIEESKQTHKDWLTYFEKNPNSQLLEEYQWIGNINHHKRCIEEYDKAVVEIEEVVRERDNIKTENGKLKSILLQLRDLVAERSENDIRLIDPFLA